MKKILILFTFVICTVFLLPTVYANGKPYTEQDRFEDYGVYLYDLGLIKGDANGNLNVNSNLTRAEAVVIILNSMGELEEAKNYPENVFKDVTESKWYAPYVNYAANKGIVSGVGGGNFAPEANVTIKQLYSLFLRAYGYRADWEKDDIMQKSEDFGLSFDLNENVAENQVALRGHAFIIFANAIEVPRNIEGHNDCVLADVLAKKDAKTIQSLKDYYEFLEPYAPGQYESNIDAYLAYENALIDVDENAAPSMDDYLNSLSKDTVNKTPVVVKQDSNSTNLDSQNVNTNVDGTANTEQNQGITSDPTTGVNSNQGQNNESTLKFVRSEQGDAINRMDLWFNEELEFHDFDYNDYVRVADVRGDYGEYSKSWFLDKSNYTTGTTGKKAYVRYNDGGASVDLQGLTFTVEYNVKQRRGDGVAKGATTIKFPATNESSNGTTSGSNNNSNQESTFEFDSVEAGALNVINLWFTDKLDYHNLGTVEVVSVSGDYGEYDEAWFLNKKHYTVGTTSKKIYIRYNDGSASVNLDGLKFKIKYDVKQRDKNVRAKGQTSINFNYKK